MAPAAPATKKSKGKKAADPNETGKLLAAKINQLELDAAGDKEQEAEIGWYFPKTPTHKQEHIPAAFRKHDLLSDMIAKVLDSTFKILKQLGSAMLDPPCTPPASIASTSPFCPIGSRHHYQAAKADSKAHWACYHYRA